MHSRNNKNRKISRASVLLASLFLISGTAVSLSLVLASWSEIETVPTPEHCPRHSGLILALRASGLHAHREDFWNGGDDFSRLHRFKVAVFERIILESNSLRNLKVEQRVLIDSMEDISYKEYGDKLQQEVAKASNQGCGSPRFRPS